ncbi:MAG: c-type cytochrome [Rhodospirillales bacterium]
MQGLMRSLVLSPAFALVLALAAAFAAAPVPAHAADGAKVFKKCKACHTLTAKNRVGPGLQGVMGKPCGSVKGFKYGKGYRAACETGAFVIDEAFLMEYLADPSKTLTAQNGGEKARSKMTFKLKKEDQRRAVIEFLKDK